MIWTTLLWTDQTPPAPLREAAPQPRPAAHGGARGRGSGWARHRAWFGQLAARGQKGPYPTPRRTSHSEGPTLSTQGGFH